MQEILYSVGIDVGTTTTQVLFSRLTLENTASTFSVPRLKIVGREVSYAGPVYITPFLQGEAIDADALRRIVEKEYIAAGMTPSRISTGAVIITGESAKKSNAKEVLRSLAGLAGEFVVTTAGSDLEGVLAGRGAGTAQLSRERQGCFANLDIGGGTTNFALFKGGAALDTSCLELGGRHVRLEPDSLKVLSVSPRYARLIHTLGLRIAPGLAASFADLKRLADRCAALMAELLRLVPRSADLPAFITNRDFRTVPKLAGLTLSGGVAAALLELADVPAPSPRALFRYGDIGPLLALSLRESALCRTLPVFTAKETIRATAVGVGVHSMELSGSTIFYSSPTALPVKDIPVLSLSAEEETGGELPALLRSRLAWFQQDGQSRLVAVSLIGKPNPSHAYITALARSLADGCEEMVRHCNMLVVLSRNDLAKALGNALYAIFGKKTFIFCLDVVSAENGDYIDLGKPVGDGRALPVVVKSLLFGK